MTPPEVDAELARLYYADYAARARLAQVIKFLHEAVADVRVHHDGTPVHRNFRGWAPWRMSLDEVLAVDPESTHLRWRSAFVSELATYRELVAELDAIAAEQAPFDAMYDAAPWPRFFSVAKGHVHSSMRCSTCNNGQEPTEFGWQTHLSGLSEAAAVADLGPLLCTVCFPSAPTEWTSGDPTADPDQCPGSGTYDYDRATARLGYYTGNFARCSHCGENITTTKTDKMRKHKRKV